MDNCDTIFDFKEKSRVFFESLSKEETFIYDIREYALKNDVPIVRDETKEFLKLILKIVNPNKILELGTAIGYSTLVFSLYTSENSKIETVENYKPRIDIAKKNFMLYDKYNKIKLIEDDISNYLNNNKNKYDLIFLDAAKAQYVVWLPYLLDMMKNGSILIADNILKEGDILESKFNIRKRDRTIHKRMREFLYQIKHNENLLTYLFNIGDGLSVSIKK